MPALLLAVRTYVLVRLGDTTLVPASGTSPIPWLIETEVAPVTLQESIADWPFTIPTGLEKKEVITGVIAGIPDSTVTVAEAIVDP